MTHFYLTLPSNSSEQYFPNNTLTDYTTKLSSTIELTNEWEVGLAEIMFPRSWYTIPKNGLYLEVDYSMCSIRPNIEDNIYFTSQIVRLYINAGYYNSMDDLTQELNHSAHRTYSVSPDYVDGRIAPPTFYFKPASRRMFVTLTPGMSVKFPPTLQSILGLSHKQNPMCNPGKEVTTIRSDLSCDLEAGIHALYIYCDLLQFTHVGDIKAPLLRVVDSGGESGEVITRYYERPRYVPLQKKNFDTIQIIIRDDLGEKIQFESGKVLLTLHFRRTHNQYFL